MRKMIEKCCICGENIEVVYKLSFKDLIGLEESYTENIGMCYNCGFIFNANPFSDEQLASRYKNLSKYEFASQDTDIFEEEDSYKKRSERQLNFVLEVCGNVKSVFEIGAASGYNLSLYKSLGEDVEVFGIEPSTINKLIAKKNYQVELYDDTFQNYIKNEKNIRKNYDLVILSHVLEHIVNPFNFMSEVIKFTNKYIYIEVPTFDYKFLDEPFGMFGEEHVNYFTFESLQSLMNKLGYYILEAKIDFSLKSYFPAASPCIMTIWQRKNNLQLNLIIKSDILLREYLTYSEKSDINIQRKIESIEDNKKLAIWGTGHHTSRLLAMTSLSNKNIIKFYESDKRKYNYKMCGKKITQFNINDLYNEEVDCILVSSYVAQKSIINSFIKAGGEKYTDRLIILYDI